MILGQGGYIGILQNIEAFGIGLHQAVFDAVVNHLDEVPCANRAGVNVALFDPGIAPFASPGAGDIADPGRERGEARVEAVYHGLVAPDHHAIAAVDTPYAARRADVEIMD